LQRGRNVQSQLIYVAQRRQGRDRHDFALLQVQSLARVEVAKRELDRHPGKVRRDFGDFAGEELLERS